MELETQGKIYYPEIKIAIRFNPREEFSPELGFGSRFRLILVQKGNGILQLDQNRYAFTAPAVFCLNELERPILRQSTELDAESVYFHPSMINFAFDFQNIRHGSDGFSPTDWQDRNWLNPFIARDEDYRGCLSLGPSATHRIQHLFDDLRQELDLQTNRFWTCRSRSYLLELLIFLNRLHSSEGTSTVFDLSDLPDDISAVLLYLHDHYPRKVTIAELAQVFHTNRTTLAQRFSEVTGMSIMAYLMKLRVTIASSILKDTNLPVAEIMNRVGFTNATHFVKTFQKFTGYAPRDYRRNFSIMRG